MSTTAQQSPALRGFAHGLGALEAPKRRRGWLIRRALVCADLAALTIAFSVAEILIGGSGTANRLGTDSETMLFVLLLPVWVLVGYLGDAYDRDESHVHHTTIDELVGVFRLVAGGIWGIVFFAWLTRVAHPDVTKLLYFSLIAVPLVAAGRASVRAVCKHTSSYVQNTIIVGADEVGQLVARKIRQHPEFRLNLLGFADDGLDREVGDVPILGASEELPELIDSFDVERVIFAFGATSLAKELAILRMARDLGVQVDLVPRHFEVVGPRMAVHSLEGLALVGLPPVKLRRGARLLKRIADVAVAGVMLVVAAPLLGFIAWRIKRTSPGPVLFRQLRLGQDMRPFTVLKFRTMAADTDAGSHRDYVRSSMNRSSAPELHGLFKLERQDVVTPTGRWLRRSSLDELPQLINVLRGEMSIVGPRPCIPYEVELYEPHHFDRFLVPAGLTGLWQVTARARSTYVEALDMDVAYAQGWSLGLDFALLLKTPFQLIRQEATR